MFSDHPLTHSCGPKRKPAVRSAPTTRTILSSVLTWFRLSGQSKGIVQTSHSEGNTNIKVDIKPEYINKFTKIIFTTSQ